MEPKLGFILKGSWLPTVANKSFWIAVIVLIISIALEFYGRACGFNLTSDSIQYLSSAKSFQLEGKFLGDDGTYNPYWPPLFPMLLSITSDPLSLLVWINILCKVIIALVIFYLANNFLKSDFYKSAFVISSMLSVYILMISVFVWTELLFMSLILLNIYFALNLNKQYYFFGLIITGFLLCIQRNAGLFWISGISVWLMFNNEKSSQKKFQNAALFFIISTSGLWAWNMYNTFILPADFKFYDRPYFEGFFNNIQLVTISFVKMIVPFQSFIFCGLFFLGVLGTVFYFLKPITNNLFLLVIGIYTGGFLILGPLDANELDRYLSVITPIVFLTGLIATERISQNASRWIRYGLMIFTILWVSYTLLRTAKNVQFWHERSCLTESAN